MIINIILIFILINLISLKTKIKNNKDLSINYIFLRFFFTIFIGFFFCVIYRLFNIIRVKPNLNFKEIATKTYDFVAMFELFNVALFLLTIYFFRKLIIYFFRKNFLVLHYFLLSKITKNYNKNIFNLYEKYFYYISFWPKRLNNKNILLVFFLLKFSFLFIMVSIFLVELIFNNYVLCNFVIMLPYFVLYQFFYGCNLYIVNNLIKEADFVVFRVLYTKNYTYNDVMLVHQYLEKILK